MWDIEDRPRVNNHGYIYVRLPEHPKATSTGYVYEHRVVVENSIGRLLTDEEVVHHKDFNKSNNAIENLELLSKEEHRDIHRRLKTKKVAVLICPECGTKFTRPRNNTHLVKPSKLGATFCSGRCRGRFSARARYHGIDEAMQRLLSNCVVDVINMPAT